MKRAWVVLMVLALLGVAGPAQAQNSSGRLFAFGGPGTVISETNMSATVQGDLVVSFHGDPGSGCAAFGLCPYSGTIVVRPRTANLAVLTARDHGRIVRTVILDFGAPDSAYTTSARVTRSVPGGPSGTCADAPSSLLGGQVTTVGHGGSVTIRVLTSGGTLLQTRCAGPLDGDLAGVSPSVTLRIARLLRGRMTIDLSGTRSFASRGLVGTLTSTLTMKLGRASTQPPAPPFPPGIKTQRVRTVIEHLNLVRVSGGLSATVQGTSNPIVCGLLDSCGLSGSLSVGDAVSGASADVFATGPANRPYADFLTALGISRSGRSRGIAVFGTVSWLGNVQASLSQGGGACTDTAATGGVAVPIGLGLGGFGGFAGPWRTRCPGPSLGNAQSLLGASVDRAALGHRQFTIEVAGRGTSSDDGYVIAIHGRLSVLLRRGRITQQVMTQPTG